MATVRSVVFAMLAAMTLIACDEPAQTVAPARTDVPEPAAAPQVTVAPAGTVAALTGTPEGLAISTTHRLIAVGVRDPDGVALVDVQSGRVRSTVPLRGAPRHLQLGGPAGPLLVPAEGADRLFQIALPQGRVVAETVVGDNPHDAAAAGDVIFVTDEFADTVSRIEDGRRTAVLPAPAQPGGIAASADGKVVMVVGVRGREVEAYTRDGRSLGRAPAGIGPTHIRAGRDRLFYVTDTQGDAVLIFEADDRGVRQVGKVETAAGAPYGLAVDTERGMVHVTLTGTNQLQSFRVAGPGGRNLAAYRTYPTVRQPNDVAVDPASGRVVVAGTADGVLQFVEVS